MKKTKSFQKYLEKRLSKDDIAEIEGHAELEIQILRSAQESISRACKNNKDKNTI